MRALYVEFVRHVSIKRVLIRFLSGDMYLYMLNIKNILLDSFAHPLRVYFGRTNALIYALCIIKYIMAFVAPRSPRFIFYNFFSWDRMVIIRKMIPVTPTRQMDPLCKLSCHIAPALIYS